MGLNPGYLLKSFLLYLRHTGPQVANLKYSKVETLRNCNSINFREDGREIKIAVEIYQPLNEVP